MTSTPVSPHRIAAELKVSPLVNTDPNDQAALEHLAETAIQKCERYKMDTAHLEAVLLMAQTIEQLGHDFDEQDWVKRIFTDAHDDGEQKIQEIHQYRLFQDVGPKAIDFPLYCILKFQRRMPTSQYEAADIHYASDIALQIAPQYQITDLLNTYACMELLLVTGGLLTKHPVCAPMQDFLNASSLTSDQKTAECYQWLNRNMASVTAQFK